MSAAERGGRAAIRCAAALHPRSNDSTSMADADQLVYSTPDDTFPSSALRQPTLDALPHARDILAITRTDLGGGKLDLSTEEAVARNGLLRESVFPDWEDDAAKTGMESPGEMQKKDPLATQIWKLYSKTKTRLPNQERMENLTWRMMALSLKRREQVQATLVTHLLRAFCEAISELFSAGHRRQNPQPPQQLPRETSSTMMPTDWHLIL